MPKLDDYARALRDLDDDDPSHAQCPVIVIAREPQERPAPQAQASAART